MTPGVAFFYGGLARSKNAVSVIGMTFVIIGLMSSSMGNVGIFSRIWTVLTMTQTCSWEMPWTMLDLIKYPTYAPLGEVQALVLTHGLLHIRCKSSLKTKSVVTGWPGTMPHQLFAMFQATFAIITPALIVGGLIDRMKFSALVIFVLSMGNLRL